MDDSSIVDILSHMAEDIEFPVQNSFRLAAAVAIRGEIIAFGTNSKRTHPFQAKFGKKSRGNFLACRNQSGLQRDQEGGQ